MKITQKQELKNLRDQRARDVFRIGFLESELRRKDRMVKRLSGLVKKMQGDPLVAALIVKQAENERT